MKESEKLVKEVAPVDLLCDKCQNEIVTGSAYYVDQANAKVYCESCGGS